MPLGAMGIVFAVGGGQCAQPVILHRGGSAAVLKLSGHRLCLFNGENGGKHRESLESRAFRYKGRTAISNASYQNFGSYLVKARNIVIQSVYLGATGGCPCFTSPPVHGTVDVHGLFFSGMLG